MRRTRKVLRGASVDHSAEGAIAARSHHEQVDRVAVGGLPSAGTPAATCGSTPPSASIRRPAYRSIASICAWWFPTGPTYTYIGSQITSSADRWLPRAAARSLARHAHGPVTLRRAVIRDADLAHTGRAVPPQPAGAIATGHRAPSSAPRASSPGSALPRCRRDEVPTTSRSASTSLQSSCRPAPTESASAPPRRSFQAVLRSCR